MTDETVGVVPLDAGDASADVMLLIGVLMMEVVTGESAAGVLATTALLVCATTVFAGAVVASGVVLVVGGCAAACVAKAPVSVVDALGTAVHRWPLIEVMKNPAGRVGLVDMTRRKATPVAMKECNRQTTKMGFKKGRS